MHYFQFPLGPFKLSKETEDNAYANFRGNKQRADGMLWYFLEWSTVIAPVHGEGCHLHQPTKILKIVKNLL